MGRKIEIERATLNSSKPFDQVVAALHAAVGHLDIASLVRVHTRAGPSNNRLANLALASAASDARHEGNSARQQTGGAARRKSMVRAQNALH